MKACIRKNKLKKGFSYTVFVDYGNVNNKRKREPLETFQTKKAAESYQAKVQSEIDNNTFINTPDITFAEAIDEWMLNYVTINCEPNTKESYESINTNYLKPILGHIPLKIIGNVSGIQIINNYFHFLRFELSQSKNKKGNYRKTLSYSSVEHHKAQISGILSYFVRCGKLSSNPCLQTTIPKTEEEKMQDVVIDDIENFEDDELYEDENFITPEQAIQVINLFMNTDMMLPVCFATFVGLRRSEIAGILKNKLDKEKRRLLIGSVRVRCGNKTIYKKKNKNKTSTRFLYLPQIMLSIIELDEKRQAKNKLIYGDKYVDSKFLCVKDNGEPVKVNYISEKFKKVFDKFILEETKKAKKEKREFSFPYITIHKLRHLNITALIASGASIKDVCDSAGHSNIETTMIYTHSYTEGKKQIADKTDEIYDKLLGIS